MLIKRKSGEATRTRLQAMANGLSSGVLDRRSFLTQSGLALGGVAAIGSIQLGAVRKAEAGPVNRAAPVVIKKNVCTHCSVGCTVTAEVQNGVWVGQEPSWDSPINRGTHCAKGASVRELVHGDRRIDIGAGHRTPDRLPQAPRGGGIDRRDNLHHLAERLQPAAEAIQPARKQGAIQPAGMQRFHHGRSQLAQRLNLRAFGPQQRDKRPRQIGRIGIQIVAADRGGQVERCTHVRIVPWR